MDDESFYIDCDYCAECIDADDYLNHIYQCRLLCPGGGNINKTDEWPIDYQLHIEAEKQELANILDEVTRDRLVIQNMNNWQYEHFERFINSRIINQAEQQSPHPGLDNIENSKYSKLIYIWGVTGSFACDICMISNYTIYRKLNCNHKLCNDCFHEWFKCNTTCPFCRCDLENPAPQP